MSDLPLSREWLRDVTVAQLFAGLPPGTRIRTDAELRASLDDALVGHDPCADVHVFGYGSLMWNPAFEFSGAVRARVHGWHRRFCLRMIIGRGTPSVPGVMLALDRGGSCDGRLFRIPAAKAPGELQLLWKREMATGAYESRWVAARTADGQVPALTFVCNRAHERYVGGLPIEQVAHMICTGRGALGTSRAYFDDMLQSLAEIGVIDAAMDRLRRVILAQQRGA